MYRDKCHQHAMVLASALHLAPTPSTLNCCSANSSGNLVPCSCSCTSASTASSASLSTTTPWFQVPPRSRHSVPETTSPTSVVQGPNLNSSPDSSSIIALAQATTSALRRIRANDATLRKLDWSNANVRDRDLVALAQALPHTTQLRHVRLHANPHLSNKGIRALVQGLLHNHSIVSITGLETNEQVTDEKTLAELQLYVRRNQVEQACGRVATTKVVTTTTTTTEPVKLQQKPRVIPESPEVPKSQPKQSKQDLAWVPPPLMQVCSQLQKEHHDQRKSNNSNNDDSILHLEWHSIDDAGAQALGQALRNAPPSCPVTRIFLDFNQIRNFGATALASGARHCHNIQELSLKHNQIGDAGIQAIMKIKQLRKLSLNQNEFGPLGCQALCMALSSSSSTPSAYCSLEFLDVSGNAVIGSSLVDLALALRGNSTLKVLIAESCQVEDVGCAALAMSLQWNHQLQVLHLGHNAIGNPGAVALSKALRQVAPPTRATMNSTSPTRALPSSSSSSSWHLTSLILHGNQIGVKGAQALVHAMTENSKLLHVDVTDNAPLQGSDPSLVETIHNLAIQNRDRLKNKLQKAQHKQGQKEQRQHHSSPPSSSTSSPQRSVSSEWGVDSGPVHSVAITVSSSSSSSSNHPYETVQQRDDEDNESQRNDTANDGMTMLQSRLLLNEPSLTVLHLVDAKLQDVDLSRLGHALAQNSVVQELRLVNNYISGRGVTAFCTSLAQNPQCSLRRLNLSCNAIGDEGAMAVANYISSRRACASHCRIGALWLLSTGLGNVGVTALVAALKTSPVEELYLQMNQIESEGALQLASLLRRDKVLRVLNLHCNQIGDAGVLGLIKEGLILNEASSLEQLVLSSNELSNEAAVALGAYVGWNPCLKLLDVSQNRISDAGLKVLSMGLTQNFRLSYLNLADNCVTDAGVSALAKALQVNGSLDSLSLCRNRHVGPAGVLALARALEHNVTLLVLAGIPEAGVDPSVLHAIQLLLERNQMLNEQQQPM